MEQTVFNNLIAHYVTQRQQGVDFTQIRQELEERNVPKDITDFLIKAIDNEELYQVELKSNQQQGIWHIVLGVVFLISPCLLLISDKITQNNAGIALSWVYGMGFTFGVPLIVFGINKYRQKPGYYKGYPTIRNQSSSGERNINYHRTYAP